jgi:ankyrin repeat protein
MHNRRQVRESSNPESGPSADFADFAGNTPLMYACAGGHLDVVEILLQSGANVEDHNENGHTPLMEAASAGYVNVAKVLLENGAGINTHSNEFKESALTLACYKGHLEMVRFLLAAGADQVSQRRSRSMFRPRADTLRAFIVAGAQNR